MIQWFALDALSFTKENPNRGNVNVIYQSIASHGYVNVVHVWGDGIVKAGEHRIRALRRHQDNGYVPSERDLCLRVIDGAWQVMCLDVSAMSEQQANQLMLMFNQSARLGEDDIDALLTIIDSFSLAEGEVYKTTGVNDADIDFMSAAIATAQAIDPDDIWQGMPAYQNNSVEPYHTLKVHFETEEAMQDFASLINQSVTVKTKYIYHPKQVVVPVTHNEVVNAS